MATGEWSATAGTVRATAQATATVGGTTAAAAAADTAVGVVVTDLTTAFTAFNTCAAAIIAITGDTFNTTTHQFTFGGATGLTHAQWATVGALLNTAMTDFVTAQTDTTTAKTDTAAAAAAGSGINNDVTVYIGSTTKVPDMNVLRNCLRTIENVIQGSGVLAIGSGSPRSP